MTETDIQNWATAFIAAQSDPALLSTIDHPDWWAVERFMYVGTPDVPGMDCLMAILAVLKMSPSEEILGTLAAGPLEDLLEYAGTDVIDDIEREMSLNPAFLSLVQKINESGTPEIWDRIQTRRKEQEA